MQGIVTVTTAIQSTPALCVALRSMDEYIFRPVELSLNSQDVLVEMYRIGSHTLAHEAESAAYLVSNIAERLRRLDTAYGEWEVFDAPAYFDLSIAQSGRLVKLIERVNTVHVTFFVDLLLPSFQQAVACWACEFAPLYRQMYQQPIVGPHFFQQIQPRMIEYRQYLFAVIHEARGILTSDVGFLATNGAQEERERWRRWWQTAPASGLDATLIPDLSQVPTLTLSFDFPLPASRQPDRLRRLRRNRERQLAQRNKRRNKL